MTDSTDFDHVRPALVASTFILVGYGDGQGTQVVHGYSALRELVLRDCGEDLDDEVHADEWTWSYETPSMPYSLNLGFEGAHLIVVRLSDDVVRDIIAAAPDHLR